ncbi:hypothetical protein GCM10009557_63710 [Virgisporangium ochraceum]
MVGRVVAGFRLGIDVGSSNTTAALAGPDGRVRPLLFDGSPVLPSGVCAVPGAGLSTGRDARHAARARPECFEPAPKRLVGVSESVLLGEAEVPVVDLVAAVLGRVRDEAVRVAGAPVSAAVLTCPAGWGPLRRGVLAAAADRVGLVVDRLVPEPVAAADYFVGVQGARWPVGACAVVYDFGGGTFDAAVVRRTPDGFEVLATEGLADVGGADIDAAVVAGLGAVVAARAQDVWRRLTVPSTPAERRAAWLLWDDVRTAKEMLSRAPHTSVHVPLLEEDLPVGREELDRLAAPVVAQTVAATRAAVTASGVATEEVAAVFLVGGASRVPLVATLLHSELGVAPTAVEQPELVVAEGALGALPTPPVPPPVRERPDEQPPPEAASEPPPAARDAMRRWRIPVSAALAVLVLAIVVVAAPGLLSAHRDGDPDAAPSPHVLGVGAGTVRDLAFSPDGRLLAVSDGDETVQIWDVASRSQVGNSHPAEVGVIRAVAFAGNGRLVTAGGNGQVRIWNVADRSRYGQPLTVGPAVDSMASTGNQVAAAVDNEVLIWDVTTGREISRFAAVGNEGGLSVALDAAGTALAAAGADGFWLWDLTASPRQVIAERGGPAYAVAFGPDGRTVVTGRRGAGGAIVWDARSGRRTATLDRSETANVYRVAVSPDGRHVATAGSEPVSSTFPVRIWDLRAPEAASPDGRYLAVGGSNVLLFDLTSGG